MGKKGYIFLSIFVVFLLFCIYLPAQVVFTPLNNSVYDFLQRLEIKGLTGKTFIDMKPLSRVEIFHLL